jgi:rhamnose utilization protein RhaD (predicted bifunctional aldolase and dehydrogenase)
MKQATNVVGLHYRKVRWDEWVARELDEPELLRYRLNLLGADLRITNLEGGNTSSKIAQIDPPDGREHIALRVQDSDGGLEEPQALRVRDSLCGEAPQREAALPRG